MADHVRIVIADDHPIMRDGLRRLLAEEPDFLVVGEACDGHEAAERVAALQPDLLLLDLLMPGASYVDVLQAISVTASATRSLLLTASIEPDEVVKALGAGARGIVLKNAASVLLMKAIRTVHAGEYWVAREDIGSLVGTFRGQAVPPPQQFGLTRRELEIVMTVATGSTNREIAQRFSLSEETVKHHLTKIFSKVGVANRVELALFAINEQLVTTAGPSRARSAKEPVKR
jgi:two-component system, NarL family, nitrate/nitrite response regulator NarL